MCKRNLISSWFSSEVHPDILTGIDETAAFLASRGATLRYDLEEQRGLADMFAMTNAFQVWGCLMSYHKHKPFAEGDIYIPCSLYPVHSFDVLILCPFLQ